MALALPAKLSDRLVHLVDIVFAVVIAQSLARYSEQIVELSPPRTLVALVVVYITTVSSWWFYYVSMKRYPYKETAFGTARFVIDLFTVVLYVYLLYSVAEIEASDNVVRYVSGFPIVFLAYMASGILRRCEYNDASASSTGLLTLATAALAACAVVYHALYSNCPSAADGWIWLFIIFPALVVLLFRFRRFSLYEGGTE